MLLKRQRGTCWLPNVCKLVFSWKLKFKLTKIIQKKKGRCRFCKEEPTSQVLLSQLISQTFAWSRLIPIVTAVLLCRSVPSDFLPCSVIHPNAVLPVKSKQLLVSPTAFCSTGKATTNQLFHFLTFIIKRDCVKFRDWELATK